MPMFTSLEGSYVTVKEVDVTTKAHQHHEGSPYSPFDTTPRRRFSTTSGRPWGGLQTLTNFSGGNHKGRFLSERLLPPRSLQPPRVTRCTKKTRGESTCDLSPGKFVKVWRPPQGLPLVLENRLRGDISRRIG